MTAESKIVIQRYQDCKAERQKNIKLWQDINTFVALTTDINSEFEDGGDDNKQRDRYVNDPTAYIAVTQLTDYLSGLLWGTGDEVLDLVPNDYIKDQLSDDGELNEFYSHATNIFLREMNHPDAGFLGCLQSFVQDQVTYATSGTGCYPSKDYIEGKGENILQFNRYGVYNSCFDEGANGKINVIFSVRNWRLSRIIDEFAVKNDEVDKELFNKLPDDIKKAYDKKQFNQKFKIVHGILPHKDYSVGKIGKIGTKYKGFWFDEKEGKIFSEEYYRELPVAVCRSIRVSNKVYGASFSSIAISSIKLLNYMAGKGVRSIEKLTDPPQGTFTGSLPAGEIVDTSAGSLTTFKNDFQGKPPLFNIGDVGDISALLQLIVPKAEKDISTIFKIDRLLDFNSQVSMTATESMQRFSIRSKSEAGIIIQILNEYFPILHRAISILEEAEAFGAVQGTKEALELEKRNKIASIIPQVVSEAINNNKRWYEIKFKNSISQVLNAEKFDWLSKFLMTYAQILQLDPSLQMAVSPYDILLLMKNILNLGNEGFMKPKREYEEAVKAMNEEQAMLRKIQAENTASGTVKNIAGAEKDVRESQ